MLKIMTLKLVSNAVARKTNYMVQAGKSEKGRKNVYYTLGRNFSRIVIFWKTKRNGTRASSQNIHLGLVCVGILLECQTRPLQEANSF